MKPFKFFSENSGGLTWSGFIPTPRRTRRNYVGSQVGVITWINVPIGNIYYLEPRLSDGVMSMQMMSKVISVNHRTFDNLDSFMEHNRNNYIWVYEMYTADGTIYRDTLPTSNTPLTIRYYSESPEQ